MVLEASKILEIGAGPGAISKKLKREKKCHITAVDIDPKYLEKLSEFCDVVHQVDLNNPNWRRVLGTENRYDVIIAAEVLEHLFDPCAALSEIITRIEDHGEVLVSLPHAECGV